MFPSFRLALHILVFNCLIAPILFGADLEQAARQAAAASEGINRQQAVTALLDAIESPASDTSVDEKVTNLWRAYRLTEDLKQQERLIKIASGVKDNRMRVLLNMFRFGPHKNIFKQNWNNHERLLLDGKPKPKEISNNKLFGNNPYDTRGHYEQWESKDQFVGRYQTQDGSLTVDILADPAGSYIAHLRQPTSSSSAVDLIGFNDENALELIGPKIFGRLNNGALKLSTPTHPKATLKPVTIAQTEWVDRPNNAIILLDETTGLQNFTEVNTGKDAQWTLLPNGVMEIGKHWIQTRESFLDYRLYLEFCVPYNREVLNQARGNSGVFLSGAYEVQILDSFGLAPKSNTAGGVYKIAAPTVNMAAPPLEWQSYLIEFTSPRVDKNGTKTSNARVTVWHNGTKVQDNLEIPKRTYAIKKPEPTTAQPIILQNHGNQIRYRNIWLEKL